VTILHIDSSIMGENSVSRQVTGRIVERLRGENPGADVVRRDLAAEPLSHLTLAEMGDSSVVDEFMAADTVVIGAPMYNWNVPSQLKAWLDRILVAGRTFAYSETGPVGLAGGKRVIVVVSRGGLYGADSPTRFLEHVETYLAGVFGIIGIEPEFIIAEGMKVSPDHEQQAIANALTAADSIAAVERLAA
jgi:FMN-dependent NADH-azoreductase